MQAAEAERDRLAAVGFDDLQYPTRERMRQEIAKLRADGEAMRKVVEASIRLKKARDRYLPISGYVDDAFDVFNRAVDEYTAPLPVPQEGK